MTIDVVPHALTHVAPPPTASSSSATSAAASVAPTAFSSANAPARPPTRAKRPVARPRRSSMETAVSARYDIISRIGSGSMGTVFQVLDRAEGRLHALKVVRKSDICDPVGRLSMRRETAALKTFRHANIVRFHHVYEDISYVYIATEYCSQGDLTDLLRRTSVPLTEHRALSIMQQVFQALEYLHAHGVSHRDVKLQNVLIAPDGSVRLADLGLVHWRRPQDTNKLSRRFCGTQEYAAPEVVMRRQYVPQFSDMWACGVTLYILLTRSIPFRNTHWDDLVTAKAINLHIMALLGGEALADVHLPCRQLLQGMLAAHPPARISAADAVALCEEGIKATQP